MAQLIAEQAETKKWFLSFLKPGDTLYTITRNVSRSGMSRRISVFTINDGTLYDLDYQIEQIGLYKRHKKYEGLVVGGCGMDMHFKVVYELGRTLFPDGFQRTDGQFSRDGGYAFQKVTL